MFRKKKFSNYELERQIRIKKMRMAFYELLWVAAHKDDKHPRPMPSQYIDAQWIQEELKEIVNG